MKYKILLTLLIISLTFSILLAFTPIDKICGEETSSCSIVQNSEYKKTLGINNSILGIITFSILIAITIFHIRNPRKNTKIFLALTLFFSTIGAIHFIYLQVFIIKALCPYCMIIDVSTILALTILATKSQL
ncbi:vitamin K epoxide reductase family protein [Candidatus Pacearchaeota archaeon]|nr:vitamin K epoxide reductase family protein [Candidatus Pacearchaeota archaeon]